jgi:N-acetylglucosaminyl-diphospho-decaprenol L-rhamnosyltransferase
VRAGEDTSRVRVDVGMVTWNTRELSVEALQRVVAVSGEFDVRILVRDNGSTDGTAAAIAAAVPQAEVDAGAENIGFAAGVNTLLERSDAPWFFLLNSDAWPEPGALEILLAAAQREPRAAVVAPRLVGLDGTVEESTHRFPSLRLMLIQLSGAYRWPGVGDRSLMPGYWRFDRQRVVDWVVGAAWLLRRDALIDVGQLDDRYVMYVEDLDWCWRAARHGWQIVFEPAAAVCHVGNVSGEQRYAAERTATWLHNTYFFYREVHGAVPAFAFRVLNIALAGRLWLAARLRRDHPSAGRWADHVRGSLRRDAPDGAMRSRSLQDDGARSRGGRD